MTLEECSLCLSKVCSICLKKEYKNGFERPQALPHGQYFSRQNPGAYQYASVCPIMWVNEAQTWEDSYCTRSVPHISAAEEVIFWVPRPGHAEKLPKGVIVPGIYIPHKGTS